MGYFKTNVRRNRAREQVRRLNKRVPPEITRTEWSSALPTGRFVRLQVSTIDQDSGRMQGIFRCAGDLQEANAISRLHYDALERALDWFNKNLDVPKIRDSSAIFYFKSEAAECIKNVWEICRILKEHDVIIEMITTASCGWIVFEDEYQVAAVPK